MLIVVVAMVGGCASQATHYDTDIVSSVSICKGQAFKTEASRIRCYDSVERPVILRDLPNLIFSYDAWHSARLSAANDYDNEVRVAQAKANVLLRSQMDTAKSRLRQTASGFWQDAQGDKAAIIKEARLASSQCMKDGGWKSASMVVNFGCDLDAQHPFLQRSVPAASDALRTFHDESLAAASEYDKAVLPVMQAATAKFGATIVPAQSAFRSQVQLALQNDAAATARQQQDIANLLSILVLGAVAGAGQHPGYSQPVSPLISTSCTTNQGITNCTSF